MSLLLTSCCQVYLGCFLMSGSRRLISFSQPFYVENITFPVVKKTHVNTCKTLVKGCHYTLTAIPTASVPKDAADGAALGTFPVQVSLMWIEDIGTFKMRLAIYDLT